jgi:hypothetical protein
MSLMSITAPQKHLDWPDHPDMCVAIENQPALLSDIRIAAAGKGGHAVLKRCSAG